MKDMGPGDIQLCQPYYSVQFISGGPVIHLSLQNQHPSVLITRLQTFYERECCEELMRHFQALRHVEFVNLNKS